MASRYSWQLKLESRVIKLENKLLPSREPDTINRSGSFNAQPEYDKYV
jgi:hypothetical protein